MTTIDTTTQANSKTQLNQPTDNLTQVLNNDKLLIDITNNIHQDFQKSKKLFGYKISDEELSFFDALKISISQYDSWDISSEAIFNLALEFCLLKNLRKEFDDLLRILDINDEEKPEINESIMNIVACSLDVHIVVYKKTGFHMTINQKGSNTIHLYTEDQKYFNSLV